MRVISNNIYERLVQDETFLNEYPEAQTSPVDLIVNKMPVTLREKAATIINGLAKAGDFSWNSKEEINYQGISYNGSNMSDIVSALVLESKRFYNMIGSLAVLKAAEVNQVDLGSLSTENSLMLVKTQKKADHKVLPTKGKAITKQSKVAKQDKCNWVRFEHQFELQQ